MTELTEFQQKIVDLFIKTNQEGYWHLGLITTELTQYLKSNNLAVTLACRSLEKKKILSRLAPETHWHQAKWFIRQDYLKEHNENTN